MLDFDAFVISSIKENDAWPLCNFAIANEDRLKEFFPGTLAQNLTPDLSKHFTAKKTNQFASKEEFLFTLKEKESQALAGLVYLKAMDWNKKQGEFAYCIGYEYEGKGLISRAINLLSEYAFKTLNLETLQIIVHKSNTASIRVAEKCNFIWQKTLVKEFTPTTGQPLDMELYELYKH